MRASANQIAKYTVAAFVAISINEIALAWTNTHYVCVGWALACMWLMFDAMLAVLDQQEAERGLKTQERHNETLHKQNLLLSETILHNNDNHLLLCELRTRLMVQSQRLRDHHECVLHRMDRFSPSLRPKDSHDLRGSLEGKHALATQSDIVQTADVYAVERSKSWHL